MNTETLVKIKDVCFSYDGELVLEDINLEVKRGEFLGIIGPNGSGKTTLLKIILGLLTPKTGSVLLFEKQNKSFQNWEKLGYVGQKAGSNVLRFPITAGEVVSMGRVNNKRWYDFSTLKDKEAIARALNAVGMEAYQNRLLTQLSAGQQQRVFIAKALASKPELLILDEPTVGVDSKSQSQFYELLRDLNTRLHLTLILVSHDIDVVAHEVTEIACINRTLIFHGKPKDVLSGNFMEKIYGKELRFVVHGH